MEYIVFIMVSVSASVLGVSKELLFLGEEIYVWQLNIFLPWVVEWVFLNSFILYEVQTV